VAPVSLQVKNIFALLLTASASIASAVTVRRFAEHGTWKVPAASLVFFLICQILLIFIPSKEEEDSALFRKERLDRTRHMIQEREAITLRIQKEIESGRIQSAMRWHEFRKTLHD
jgi:cyanate permease